MYFSKYWHKTDKTLTDTYLGWKTRFSQHVDVDKSIDSGFAENLIDHVTRSIERNKIVDISRGCFIVSRPSFACPVPFVRKFVTSNGRSLFIVFRILRWRKAVSFRRSSSHYRVYILLFDSFFIKCAAHAMAQWTFKTGIIGSQ